MIDLDTLIWWNDREGRWSAQGEPLFEDAAEDARGATVAVSVWPIESGRIGVLEDDALRGDAVRVR